MNLAYEYNYSKINNKIFFQLIKQKCDKRFIIKVKKRAIKK